LNNEKCSVTLYYKVLFMNEQNQHLETLQDIKKIMERSSRFLSLSGLSGIAAGICALAGSVIAYEWIRQYYNRFNDRKYYLGNDFQGLKYKLLSLAAVVLAIALLSAFYFTWRRAKKNNVSLWNHTSKKLLINMLIPLVTGGLFILAMLSYDEWKFIAPVCLIFYGLALVNASKYTLSEIRYLGLIEIVLGLINTQFVGYGLYFWAAGFGLLHIVYGLLMWWKYEKSQ
jgi:hypothetical protein